MTLSATNKKLLSNFLSLAILRGSTYILPLLTLPYLIRVLGAEKFGLVMFAQAFVMFFNILVDYGFNLTATRNISIHRSNLTKVSEIFHAVYAIKILFLFLSFLIMSAIVFSFSRFSNDWELYFVSFGLVIGQAMFPTWFFQGMEKMKFITYLTIISKVIFTLLIFILVKEQSDYILVPIINALGMLVAGALSMFIVYKTFMIPFLLPSIQKVTIELKEGFYIFIASFQSSILANSGIFVLGLFQDNTTVGYYAAIEKLAKGILGLFSPITQTLYPHTSKALKESKEKGTKLIVKFGKIVLSATLALVIILIVFDEDIVQIVLGNEIVKYSYLLQLFAIWIFFGILNNFIGIQYLTGLGKSKIYAKAFTIASIITFTIFVLFTKIYSFNAIIYGMIIGEVLLTSIMLKRIRKQDLYEYI